jgi:hypothetical protein
LVQMSLAEIIKQLPELTSEERSTVLVRLRELAEEDELQFLHEAADKMFLQIDEQEANDAHREAR